MFNSPMPSAFRVVAAGADTAGETAEGSEDSPEEDCRRRELLNVQAKSKYLLLIKSIN